MLLVGVDCDRFPCFRSLRRALPPTTSPETKLARSYNSAFQISGNASALLRKYELGNMGTMLNHGVYDTRMLMLSVSFFPL